METLTPHLKNWDTINEVLTTLREDQVLAMLEYEQNHQRRISILERLHQRYNVLRCSRERVELLKTGRLL
jgi:hypothetical protein